ncbi:hypothetical protein NYW84_12550 [Acinetobacter junii]|uniref:DUF6602 domain-containing protein n=1 Tax=Acinetobacter TaxID=469 RepID=UPI00168A507E|nr:MULTISPECIES: DUF6602 domain-containing protein [Acinetobacter]MCT9263216.1 hypothetical protein [Acinetobacter baumannii]MEB8381844.1 hypothetical protein [Acinetobacter junii]QNX88370.1 hypothetical protein IC772_04380 [Acinetobacter seifertii]
MELQVYDLCIYMDDNWDNIKAYHILYKSKNEITICTNLLKKENKRIIPFNEFDKLKIFPFSFFYNDNYTNLRIYMQRVGNFICAFLNKSKSLTLKELTDLLKSEKKFDLNEVESEWIIRCLTAAKMINASSNKEIVSFSVSPAFIAIENERNFSAAIAGELEALSERIRFIIKHAPTAGTYRETLLQNTLKKHLPERYHVATGFIYGVEKQIDILIYDKVDYAPIFRETDLVIVPPESVRAVIEVKTNITHENLRSALELLNLASHVDDVNPPFFKGIFAFETQLTEESLYRNVADFYSDLAAMSQGAPGILICSPFEHLSCICVHNKAFAYIKYNKNKNKRLVPFLYSKHSATGLSSQTSFFIQNLLAHLKFGGMKPYKINYLNRMLGEDSIDKRIRDLREQDDSWGAYFKFDNEYDEDGSLIKEIREMERLIISSQNWINGEENF